MNSKRRTIVSIDFDGVLNSFKSGYEGPGVPITDPPVQDAIDFLIKLVDSDDFEVNIFSCRNVESRDVLQMQRWLGRQGVLPSQIDRIDFPFCKPFADIYIDDKAFRFEGIFPSIEYLKTFKPWMQESEEDFNVGDLVTIVNDYYSNVFKEDTEFVIDFFGMNDKNYYSLELLLPDDTKIIMYPNSYDDIKNFVKKVNNEH